MLDCLFSQHQTFPINSQLSKSMVWGTFLHEITWQPSSLDSTCFNYLWNRVSSDSWAIASLFNLYYFAVDTLEITLYVSSCTLGNPASHLEHTANLTIPSLSLRKPLSTLSLNLELSPLQCCYCPHLFLRDQYILPQHNLTNRPYLFFPGVLRINSKVKWVMLKQPCLITLMHPVMCMWD